MWRSKKYIIVAMLVVVVVAGSIGGVALAQSGDEEENQPKARGEALLERVCEIYNEANPEAPIDCEALEAAFTQANDQIRTEARERFRQRLIDEDIMTEEQLEEWEKWLESRPEFPTEQFKEWMETRPDFPTDEFKDWMEARPDIPFPFGPGNRDGVKPFGDGHRGFGKFGGGFPRLHRFFTPDTD